ncbi:MAG: diphthamide synthesis protein [Nanoarchaeota archaeon]
METLFVPAYASATYRLPESVLTEISSLAGEKKQVGLCSAVQFVRSLPGMREQLERAGYSVSMITGTRSRKEGQVLGCDAPENVDVGLVLYVGDGMFHPRGVQLKNPVEVLVYNPFSEKLQCISEKDAERLRRRQQGAYLRFLESAAVGVLISLKPGQCRIALYEGIRKKFPSKKYYPVIFDSIDFSSLEDFPFIDVWVNTACPRIGYEDVTRAQKPVLNAEYLLSSEVPPESDG